MWCEGGGIKMLRYIAWSGQETCIRNPFWVMQVNIKPPKSSWERVILSKQRIHYHCQKSHMSYRCHQTSEMLISELPVWHRWHVLKMKEEEKANHSPNLKYFLLANSSFDAYKQNWASWDSLKQHRNIVDSYWMRRPWVSLLNFSCSGCLT